MQHPWKRFGFPCDAAALRAPSWPIEYGLGMMRFALPRALTPLRAVPELIGHSGSTGTWLFCCPRYEVLFAGAVDDISAGPVPFRRVIPQVLRAVADGNRDGPPSPGS
jgi:D-alanyl-D-alanine carboxypeptidase